MKKLLFILVIVLTGCSSTVSGTEEGESNFVVDIEVVSTSSWSEEDTEYQPVRNASIQVYKNNEFDRTIESNEGGNATISEKRLDEVCILLEQDNQSNIIGGYIVNGVFESNNDISASASQENMAVGNVKFLDLNADGVIDDQDKASCQPVNLYETEQPPVKIYLAIP